MSKFNFNDIIHFRGECQTNDKLSAKNQTSKRLSPRWLKILTPEAALKRLLRLAKTRFALLTPKC